ncbi:hypothetical protein ANANG_G00319810 [Anguilla anguilla]|uniref:Uncharacterized protein n=1 Tax=Anguilla anguilla TaxID=7936 RepID=A0A9D3RH23_ANGAN|nr:hypothetical protein ANANG_G00319810 [Anguilla anguilla]
MEGTVSLIIFKCVKFHIVCSLQVSASAADVERSLTLPDSPRLIVLELASAGEDPVATEPLQTSLSLTDPPVTTSRSQEGYGTASLLRGRLTSFQPTRPSSPYISLPSLRPGSHQATLQPLQPSPPPSPSLTPSARLAVVGAQGPWEASSMSSTPCSAPSQRMV